MLSNCKKMIPFNFLFFLMIIILALIIFIKFYKADGDFTLLSKKVKPEEFEDRVVWIVGAGRGIGEAIAKHFASLGAKIILSSRNEVELKRVRDQLVGKHAPRDVKILPLDLASGEDSLKESVVKAEAFFPDCGVDYLIHNAVHKHPKGLAIDLSEESLKATYDVNVLGPITLSKLLAPYMLKRGRGHFVVMGSMSGKVGTPSKGVYSSTKFALQGYFHCLRSELFQRGIRVTVVCPGPIRMFQESVPGKRCAELIAVAVSNGLKEVWIARNPALMKMYVAQYMPTICFWYMDKNGGKLVEESAQMGKPKTS